MRACRIIITFFVFTASHPAFAQDGGESCRADLKSRSVLGRVSRSRIFAETKIFGAQVLDPAAKQKIAGVLTNKDLNAADFERVREIYFEARTAMLSPELALIVRAHPVKIEYSEDADVDADQNRVTVPPEFADTILPTLLWAHELEHVIQFALLGMFTSEQMSFVNELRTVLTISLDPRARYWGEFGAMLGEWEILNVSPDAVINGARKMLEARPEPELNLVVKRLKQQLTGDLNAGGTREAYVRGQHATGRYSVGDFSKVAGLYSAVVTGTGTGLVLAYQVFCGLIR